MQTSEIQHLEVLSAIDDLRTRVREFVKRPSDWGVVSRCQGLLDLVLARVETLRIRLEAPLVVATFGGTGTGKSSLVNALIGQECTRAGRQRPTTRQPVIVAHPRTDLAALGIPLDESQVVLRDSLILENIVLIDCPDPDSDEEASSGSNLERLHGLLPYCDVLLYISTQQKYRSARVSDELIRAAQGCRMLFVQTHADLDEDIRDDWRKTLQERFSVPEMFFVDSNRALQEQQSGLKPTGEAGRLIDFLTRQLGASSRVGIRRANVIDLLQVALVRCQEIVNEKRRDVATLTQALVSQREQLVQRMVQQLEGELLSGRGLWERRLLHEVCENWGLSPFAWVLRGYNGLGTLVASMTFFRARSTAQIALLGAVQGVRWLESLRKDREAEASLERLSSLGLDDALLREAEIVMDGHVRAAGFGPDLLRNQNFDDLRREASRVEGQFVDDARQHVDGIIRELSLRNSRWLTRITYEILFLAYLAFVLYRVGRNFFYESFMQDKQLLSSDFYIAAGLFLILWTGLLVMLFVRRLRTGLTSQVSTMLQKLVTTRLSRGLFPQVDSAAREALVRCDEIDRLATECHQLRQQLAGTPLLGARKAGEG